jgi:DNA-binding GntR family transcriptional regulator
LIEEEERKSGVVNRTLVDQVTANLRAAILDGKVVPGQRLKIKDLTQRFGVSHIPIRESLLRLQSEGLVVHLPHRGVTVAALTLDESKDIYDARRVLERAIAERAVGRVTEDIVRGVSAALDDMERAANSDMNAYLEAHRLFHSLMLRPGTPRLLEQTLRQLWQASERYVRFLLSSESVMELAQTHHKRMFAYFRNAEQARFIDLLLVHLAVAEEAVQLRMASLAEP